MTTPDFITELFCRVDDVCKDVSRHPQAVCIPTKLSLSDCSLPSKAKAVATAPFIAGYYRNYLALFPQLPERTRLFRLFKTHQDLLDRFLAAPTSLGVCDSYGIELLHPMREGRSTRQIGKKGKSNHRWIIGGKLCYLLNQWGLIVDWEGDTANVSDQVFTPMIESYDETMVVFTDTGFHSKDGDPPNMKVCPRGTWNERMMVEQVLSMLTRVCHFKQVAHRVWEYFKTRLAFTMSLFNILVLWDGLQVDEDGLIRLSIARFSL